MRHFRQATFFAARYRALFGMNGLRIFRVPSRARRSRMTSEELEVFVRAMMLAVDNLEAGPVKHSMQEASTLVLAHVIAARGLGWEKN